MPGPGGPPTSPPGKAKRGCHSQDSLSDLEDFQGAVKQEVTSPPARQSLDLGGKRQRRTTSAVSYKEPPLGGKLRRGDPGTSTIYDKDQLEAVKDTKKKSKPKRSRGALSTISNTIDSE